VDSEPTEGPLVFAGSVSPRLTKEICCHLGVAVARGEVLRFSEGTLFPRVLENVRGRRVCSGSTP
jgi:ribose-phosphate pyrophosphokinase